MLPVILSVENNANLNFYVTLNFCTTFKLFRPTDAHGLFYGLCRQKVEK